MENVFKTKAVDFQEKLEPIKQALKDLILEFDVKNGLTIKVSDGQVRAFIDVGEFS